MFLIFVQFCTTGKTSNVVHEFDEEDKGSKANGGISNGRTDREVLPPPPPLPRRNHIDSREKEGPTAARAEDDDIFVGEGVEYEVPGKDIGQSPISEDMEESPRNKEKVSYFTEPAYDAVQPSGPPQTWQDMVWWSWP